MVLLMHVRQCQVALFCQVNLEDKFDGEPILIPAIPDSPPEIPGIVLQSKDGTSSLTVSSARVDITTRYEPGAFDNIPTLIESEKDFISTLAESLSRSGQVEGPIRRIGVIVSLAANTDDSTLSSIRARFLSQELQIGQHRTETGFLDRQSWDGFEVNRWLRLTTSRGRDGSGSVEAAFDFNTIPEEDYNICGKAVSSFLEQLKIRADDEMKVFDV